MKSTALIAVPLSLAALVAAAASLSTSPAAEAAAYQDGDGWSIDTVHSGAQFVVRHAGVTPFGGRFDGLSGTVVFNPDNLETSRFDVQIDLESVNTGSPQRDDHLRSPDFFNTKQFPVATFSSDSIRRVNGDTYEMTGDLSLHGETREITATLDHVGNGSFRGAPVMGFEAEFEIKRADFGINTYIAPDGGDDGPLGNTVHLRVFIEAANR